MSTVDDFDFLHGSWIVQHRKLRVRLAGCDDWDHFAGTLTCHPTSAGFGNMDDNWLEDPSGPYGAIAVRSFDPNERTWSIWWLDQRSPHHLDPPVIGRFIDGIGTFATDHVFDDRRIIVRFRWLDTATLLPRWEQAFSPDYGATWEVNWEMWFTPTTADHDIR
jgi:hypothetical protein